MDIPEFGLIDTILDDAVRSFDPAERPAIIDSECAPVGDVFDLRCGRWRRVLGSDGDTDGPMISSSLPRKEMACAERKE